MANDWFQFKHFIVYQDNCAMKTGTDGVLLGAWATVPAEGYVLDVGTGCGLIGLMIAQRTSEVNIDAVEIEDSSFFQARENFNRSKWKGRLAVFHSSFQEFAQKCQKKYGLIVCNPPFFKGSMKAPGIGRNLARHDDRLEIRELFSYGAVLLCEDGILSIILPFSRLDHCVHLAEQFDLICFRMAKIKSVPEKDPGRVLLEFSKKVRSYECEEFTIEDGGRHVYSERYKQLTSDFYLKM